MEKEYNPLVSIIVITYNSSRYVLETLESAKEQTYKNVELIVSDDFSTDNTIEICEKWIEKNKYRFVNVQLITVTENTGTSANMNRALRVCKGEWIKGIAADDILLSNCIEDFVSFVNNHPDAHWVSSYIQWYRDSFDEKNCILRKGVPMRDLYNLSTDEQLKIMAYNNKISAPSVFVKKSLIDLVGGYDESYPFEDYVFFVDVLEHGYKCFFMDVETVCYRVHHSISHTHGELFNYSFSLKLREFQTTRCFKYLSRRQIKGLLKFWNLHDFMVKHGLNKNIKLVSIMYNTFYLINNYLHNIK